MADLFAALKPKKKTSSNGFDLSQKHVFSMKAGQAIPVCSIETVPNDYHEIDLAAFHRSQTLNAASFLRGKFTYDAFFVPYAQSFHPFNQFISQRVDKHSTLQLGHEFVPVFNLGQLLEFIVKINFGEFIFDDEVLSNDLLQIHSQTFSQSAVRLLDMLGYGNFFWVIEDSDTGITREFINQFKDKYCNLFRVLAYQHIWYDVYRNKYYDLNYGVDSPNDYVDIFNVDDLDCSTFANSILPIPQSLDSEEDYLQALRIIRMFSIDFVQWKKDLFTSLMPGQQFGAVSSVPLTSTLTGTIPNATGVDSGRWFNSVSPQPVNGDYVVVSDNGKSVSAENYTGSYVHTHSVDLSRTLVRTSSLDVLTLRRAELLQRWKQATLRAGNMTKDQFRAHYGVEPDYDMDENVRYLGSWESPFNINPIESTASTGGQINGSVGDIAATGTATVQGSKVKFHCNDFGVIMIIAYFRPEADYKSLMIDKANTLYEKFDFFTEEFQNYGLEAVNLSQLDAMSHPEYHTSVLGYAPRYFMYKTAVDKIHGEFYNTRQELENGDFMTQNGVFTPWAAPRVDDFFKGFGDDLYRAISSFYVDPAVLNPAFAIASDPGQSTDQFICNCFVSVRSIRPMSVIGMAEF